MRLAAAALAVSAFAAATAAFATDELNAVLGRALFDRDWVPAPASTDAADGLGPLYSARSCVGCHVGATLAGRFTEAPEGRIAARGLVMRFGDAEGRADPHYGRVLQTQAVQGMIPEGRIVVAANTDAARGYDIMLDLEQGALHPETHRSLRFAPPLAGRAALERIDAAAILALADPDDSNGDGISGRARMIATDAGAALGRYGWKADAATLKEQVADAFAVDMGLSSALRPFPHGDCTPRQAECLAAPSGASERLDGHELSDEMIDLVATFLASLPAFGAEAGGEHGKEAGAQLFADIGCAACHVPVLPVTGGEPVALYTDLLLHDMGPDLDDGVGAPGISSAEWRTAPLVGVGVGEGRRYLHDGRAATVDAAIRAHGGEADAARTNYIALEAGERAALLAFVESL